MAGLLGGMKQKMTGLLGDPALKDAFWLTLASGADPARADEIQRQKIMEDEVSQREQERQLRLQQLQMQMRQQQEAEAQRRIGNVTMQHYAENPNAVAFGGPGATREQKLAGLLSRGVDTQIATGLIPTAGKPTSLMQNAQAAGIDLNTPQGQAQFRRMLEAQQQQGMGGPGQYFAGVTVQMPDGSFAQVQPGNRPGMGVNTVPLPGAPLTYDPSVAAAIAAARASGTKQGEREGARIANNPETQMTIAEIEAASADGGLIDKSTGSGIGTAVDSTAGLFGVATDGAQAIAQLKPIADRALKMVPRFEGPQSDKDTQSYREAAGQLADPTVPREVRKAAAREIVRLMKARQGQFIDTSAIQPGSPVPGTSAAQQPAAPDRQTVVDFNTL